MLTADIAAGGSSWSDADCSSSRGPASASVSRWRSVVSSALFALSHLDCLLHGHDALPHYEGGRMFLRCGSCGHETAGWDLTPSRQLVATSSCTDRARSAKAAFTLRVKLRVK